VHGGLVYCAGQAGVDPSSGRLVDGVEAQTRQALANVAIILSDGKSDLSLVLQARVFLRNAADFASVDRAFGEAFGARRPARTPVPCTDFREGLDVEIDVIAAVRAE
jgi:2-iminobutanoate/2-iminopropanoate deaminase